MVSLHNSSYSIFILILPERFHFIYLFDCVILYVLFEKIFNKKKKSKVYCNPYPVTTEQLKKNIIRECRRIKMETVQAVINNFNSRIQFILTKKGSWFEQILNY